MGDNRIYFNQGVQILQQYQMDFQQYILVQLGGKRQEHDEEDHT